LDSLLENVLSKSTVLLVEDETRLRKNFKKVLKLWVKKVIEAGDGAIALEYFDKYRPDILITDIKMPSMNGLELIHAIRQTDKNVPIVVTSAYADQAFLLESIKLSLVEYLIKPVQEESLSKVLEACAKILLENQPKCLKIANYGYYDFQNKLFVTEVGRENIKLTPKEAELIELLLKYRGNLLTKQEIEDHLYIYEEAPPSALKNLVFKLRKKLNCELIETVSRLGYRIA
jgi:DNA-binding response OmpR family regulator